MEGNTLPQQREAAARGARSPGGVYLDTLERLFPEIRFDVVNAAEAGDILPPGASLSDYDGLVIGGSSLHVYDREPEVTRQIDLVRSFAETGKPILGSCWGLQVAAVAAGGDVARNPRGREIVFARKITLNALGRAHPFFDGKPDTFDAPCIHYDEVTALPAGAVILCSNHHSEIQGAIVPLGGSEIWAVQYHPEFDLRQMHDLVDQYGDNMIEDGFFEDGRSRAAYQEKLGRLADEPSNRSLGWQLGINEEVLDDRIRSAEIGNWVRHCVLGCRQVAADRTMSIKSNHSRGESGDAPD